MQKVQREDEKIDISIKRTKINDNGAAGKNHNNW